MTIQKQRAENLFANTTNQANDWVVVDGKHYKKYTDENGDFIIKGGTKKVYLEDYFARQSLEAKKAKVQQEINNFFSNQISDFKEWEDYYASKAGMLLEEVGFLTESIKTNTGIENKNTSLLNPLYKKYGTHDVGKFEGTDKTNGKIWEREKDTAASAISDAWCGISVKKMFIETYTKLMNHSRFCGSVVQKMAS